MDKSAEKHFHNITKYTDLIFSAEKFLWNHPEVGFCECNSSAYLSDKFMQFGYRPVMAGDIPGFYADIETGRPGPKLLCIAEMDALFCETHPNANPQTHAVHACGHHAQGAALLGIAAALKEADALAGLYGSIRLMAVPAEELIDLDSRLHLKEQGIIKYLNGKTEFMHRGFFDSVDIVFMVHTSLDPPGTMGVHKGCNGCVVKKAVFKGVSAHAGYSPHLGINALYAATQAINAINSLRETFIESEHIRVHSIITKGGDTVNTIPDEVIVETFVRGADYQFVAEVSAKVNRALAASAASIGCNVVISDLPGYFPMTNDPNLLMLSKEAMNLVTDTDKVSVLPDVWDTYSTDMGDVSAIFPVIYLHCGGATGKSHGSDYRVSDVNSACVNSAKCQLMLIDLLLRDGAAAAQKVIKLARQPFSSVEDYLTYVDQHTFTKTAVFYNDDGSITLDFR